jgi:hypothetical protein
MPTDKFAAAFRKDNPAIAGLVSKRTFVLF